MACDKTKMLRPQLCSYHNRHYRSTYGTQAGTWLYNTVKNIASVNPAITVTQFTHSFNQPSIIVQIPGNSTNLGEFDSSLLE